MFYIVEQEEKLISLEKLARLGVYVDIIPTNNYFHPKLSSTVAIYLRLLGSDHGYIIPINHSEGLNVSKDRVYAILKKASKLYTLNKKELLYHFNLQDAIELSGSERRAALALLRGRDNRKPELRSIIIKIWKEQKLVYRDNVGTYPEETSDIRNDVLDRFNAYRRLNSSNQTGRYSQRAGAATAGSRNNRGIEAPQYRDNRGNRNRNLRAT